MSALRKHKNIIILCTLFLLEFALFRTCVQREIIGNCPRNIDQAVFMRRTYHMYENIVLGNYGAVFEEIQSSLGQGAFPVFGLVYLFLFGNSRFSLLLVNFTLFILTQIIGFYAVEKMTRSSKLGFVFLGLFLMIQSPFLEAGDMFDYRMDFSAFCLYTCWMSLLVAAYYLQDKKMYYLSAVFCGMVLLFRCNTLAYLGISFFLFECVYVFIFRQEKLKKEILKLVKYGCVVIVSGGWFIFVEFKQLFYYYVTAHVTSDEPLIRMVEQGIQDTVSYLLFYPRSLIDAHLGKLLSCFLLFLIIGTLAWYFINKKRNKELKVGENEKTALLACVCGFISPFIVLTIDISKSSVVICIVAGAAIILAMWFLIVTYNKKIWHEYVIYILGITAVLLGLLNYIGNTTKVHVGYEEEIQKEMVAINTCMEKYLAENELTEARLIVDRVCDAITTDVLTVLMWENKDLYVDVRAPWRRITIYQDYTPEEVDRAIERADLMVLAKNGYNRESYYPTDASYDKYREYMLQYAYDNLLVLGEYNLNGDILIIFGRGQAKLIPQWGEWLGDEKNWLIFTKQSEQQQEIIVEGNLGGGFNNENEVQPVIEYEGKKIPVRTEIADGRYIFCIDISNLEISDYSLEIKFDHYFIPNELGINEDTRKLVVMAPDKVVIR